MFDDIEKSYQKGLQQNRFAAYYWPRAAIVVLVAILVDALLGFRHWLVYGCAVAVLVVLVLSFFIREYYRAHKTIATVRETKGASAKLAAYYEADDLHRIDNLVIDLAHHNLHTKADLELALSYYQSRLPSNSRPNILEWIFTAIITLSSIVIVTYDSTINTINIRRLIGVFAPTIIVVLIILTPLIIAKLISAGISNSRNKIDTSLVQDLAFIYVNFDRYRDRLAEKSLAVSSSPRRSITKAR